MKYTKLFSVIAFAIAAAFTVAKAETLVGSSYVTASANIVDPKSKLTASNLYGGTLAVNIAPINHFDFGASVDVARLQDNRVDTSNFKGEFTTTAYTSVWGFKPFVRGGLNWNWNRTSTQKFQALGERVGVGIETDLLKNLSVGGEYYVADVQKAVAGGSQRVFRPYATFWLNNHLGVVAAYTYNQTTTSVGYSLGGVLKF